MPGSDDRVIKTNPDPTEAVKEALTLAIKNIVERFDAKFESGEKAVILARQELRDQLIALNNTIDGKFIANQNLVDQLAKANAVALSAALQTQKESAAGDKVAINDLLKQLQAAFETANRTTNEKIDRITSRLDIGEAGFRVSGENKQERTVDRGQSFQQASMVIAAIAGIIALIALIAPFVGK